MDAEKYYTRESVSWSLVPTKTTFQNNVIKSAINIHECTKCHKSWWNKNTKSSIITMTIIIIIIIQCSNNHYNSIIIIMTIWINY